MTKKKPYYDNDYLENDVIEDTSALDDDFANGDFEQDTDYDVYEDYNINEHDQYYDD